MKVIAREAIEAQAGRFALAVTDIDEGEIRRARESRLIRRKIRAPRQPVTVPEHAWRNEKAIDLGARARAFALCGELGCELLVGIQVENPRVPKGEIALRVISLAGERIEPADEDPRTGLARDPRGAIGRAGIEDYHVVARSDRGEARG